MVSVDGYIADDNDDVCPLFEWYFNGDVELVDGGPTKVSQAPARTTSSTTWHRRSRRRRSSRALAPLRWRRATSVGRPSR